MAGCSRIIGRTLGAIGALFSIGGSNPWWSLIVFALCVYVVHGIIVFGEDRRTTERSGESEPTLEQGSLATPRALLIAASIAALDSRLDEER